MQKTTKKGSSGCKQVTIKYFQLSFRDGYAKSSCDCMECSTLENNFPFVARKDQLTDNNMGLVTAYKSELMFLNWFLELSRNNQKVRLCPDILYLTYEAEEGTLLYINHFLWSFLCKKRRNKEVRMSWGLMPQFWYFRHRKEGLEILCSRTGNSRHFYIFTAFEYSSFFMPRSRSELWYIQR